MKISYNWLQDYFEEKLPTPEHIGALITMHSFEVDSISTVIPGLTRDPEPVLNSIQDSNSLDSGSTAGTTSGDVVFDFKILPDRAHDAMSHYGIAREIGILLNLKPKDLEIESKVTDDFSSHKLVTVTIEDQSKVRRAMKRVVRNIKVGESPEWLKNRLESIGQRSINNVVDVANFVMFETGQPVHTFDFDKVYGDIKHLSIRSAKEGETLTALDGKTYSLDETILVIADEKEALDIAGIKGGQTSGIDENTKTVMLSVCNFEPTMIRKTRTKLGLKTDASDRFERGLSTKLPKLALLRLSYLLQQVAEGEVSEDFVDTYEESESMRHVIVSLSEMNSILGLDLSEEGLEGLFRKLQFGTEKLGHSLYRVDIPTNRLDLTIPADIAEEIMRILGYDLLPSTLPKILKKPEVNETFYKILWARNKLLREGYSEVYTYTFRNKGEVGVLASASDKKFLRENLKDGLKESIELNRKNLPLLGMDEVKVFEIGTVFSAKGGSASGGKNFSEVIHVAYGDVKNITEVTLDEFCNNMEISDSYDRFFSNETSETKRFRNWSQYPFIVRDIALWVPKEVESHEVNKIIKENAGELCVTGPTLFDEFSKDGKKSYAFRLVFQAMDRTLTDEEINKIMEKIAHELEKHVDWGIR